MSNKPVSYTWFPSAGLRTEAGKADSSLNALTHGLRSARTVMPWESQQDYDELHASFLATYAPATALEEALLTEAIECFWRLRRARAVENAFVQQREETVATLNPDLAGPTALALLFVDPEEARRLRLILRYVTAAERAWRRAFTQFENVRKDRLKPTESTTENVVDLELEALAKMGNLFRQTEPAPQPESASDFVRKFIEKPDRDKAA